MEPHTHLGHGSRPTWGGGSRYRKCCWEDPNLAIYGKGVSTPDLPGQQSPGFRKVPVLRSRSCPGPLVPWGSGARLGPGAAGAKFKSSPVCLLCCRTRGAGLLSAPVLQLRPRELGAGGPIAAFLSGRQTSCHNSAAQSSLAHTCCLSPCLPTCLPLRVQETQCREMPDGYSAKDVNQARGLFKLGVQGRRSSGKCTFGSRPHRHGNPTHGWSGSTKGGKCGLKIGSRVAMGTP